jgi:hypothetical protein
MPNIEGESKLVVPIYLNKFTVHKVPKNITLPDNNYPIGVQIYLHRYRIKIYTIICIVKLMKIKN